MVAEGEMLEHAHVFGNFYGSPMAPVAEAIDAGRDVLFDIDWQGAQQIRNSALGRHTLSIFILPPSIPELHRRLVSRGQDGAEVIAKRMQKSWDEISHWDGYDYVLVNDDLDATFERLKTIVTAERLRREQQPGLAGPCARVADEFQEEQDMIYALDGIAPEIARRHLGRARCQCDRPRGAGGRGVGLVRRTLRGDNEEIRVGAGRTCRKTASFTPTWAIR